ncbi:hypothetical protein [Rhodovulum marinum]|uniref:Uncharacterized protein n=1 Tax=Rhodovulum marinum TaxID=320662 RepID=A0A4R2PQU0_9RHOB|nr:hypothetical protein [Rhodovulum marinum]TCP38067.1 hypothetical protein EV662_12211 [Rhodovulum marinum]
MLPSERAQTSTERHDVANRVYSPEDWETDVTPRDIFDLPIPDQVEFITLWFRALFEDPQNEMPYADKEDPGDSAYRYPWGGPFDARDEIGDHFGGLASEEAIEAAIEEVERDGIIEWAPGPNHPERRALEAEAMEDDAWDTPPPTLQEIQQRLDAGVVPSFGDPFERQQRDALRRELAELRTLLTHPTPQHGGMGHNRPPESLTLDVEVKVEVIQAIDRMDSELAREEPDLGVIARAVGTLKKIVVAGAALTAGGFMAAAGTDLYAKVADGTVWARINSVADSTLEWLNTVTLPF